MPEEEENTRLTLDDEWVELIASARSIGLTYEEIRLFLRTVADDAPRILR